MQNVAFGRGYVILFIKSYSTEVFAWNQERHFSSSKLTCPTWTVMAVDVTFIQACPNIFTIFHIKIMSYKLENMGTS
jgi:hypothetical protein